MKKRLDSADWIQGLSDEDLEARMRQVRVVTSRAHGYGQRELLAEEDFCYYFREQEVRQQRREFHQAWLSKRWQQRDREVSC